MQDEHYTILAVDDAKDTLMLLDFDLSDEGYKVISAESGEDCLTLLSSEKIDLVLLDIYMPGLSGLDTLRTIKEKPELSDIPVIMLSASDDEDQIVTALEIGAVDYVTKPYIAKVLLARIRTSLRLVEKTRALSDMAKIDFLTQVNNRMSFEQLTKMALNQCTRSRQAMSIAMLDIDHFKQINDKYGHHAGDETLRTVAQAISFVCRDYDILGRIGGEEFALCMPNTCKNDALKVSQRCLQAIQELQVSVIDHKEQYCDIGVTISIGLFTLNVDSNSRLEEMMQKADLALYQAKKEGRNRIVVHSSGEDNESTDGALEKVDIMNHENMPVAEGSQPQRIAGIDYDIGVNNVLGDDALYQEILLMFLQDHGEDKDNIEKAIANRDEAKLKSLVHTLKGVACSIGAMELFEHCKVLDVAVNEHDDDQYQVLFQPVAKQLEVVYQGISDFLN
jgi:diguanylate cyclase (GGDEF)-like protein